MKLHGIAVGASILALFLALSIAPNTVAAQADARKARRDSVERNLTQSAIATGRFTTLMRYVDRAGLADTLSNWGPFTIFAPTDAAFARLPLRTTTALLADTARLRKLLLYHIFVGSAFKHHILDLSESIMMQGDTVRIRVVDGGARLNERANITSWTLRASNGVIHTIDRVLLPPTSRRSGVRGTKRGRE